MNTRQIVFFVLAILCSVLSLQQYYTATSVVPGWHFSLSDSLEVSPLTCVVLFLAIAVVYGYTTNFPAWYFWLHAMLSAAPILFIVIKFSLLDTSIKAHQDDIISAYRTIRILNILFITTQVVFFLYVLIQQYREKRRL